MSRAIFMIGIPGSGKSGWMKNKDLSDFFVINADQLRAQYLEKMGIDPANPSAIFSPEMVAKGYELAFQKMDDLTRDSINVVVDMTNITLKRVPLMAFAHARKYSVQAVIFKTENAEINQHNIGLRTAQGGLSLSKDSHKQLELLKKMSLTMNEELQGMTVDPSYNNNHTWQWQELPQWLLTSSQNVSVLQSEYQMFKIHDVFHSAEILHVKKY